MKIPIILKFYSAGTNPNNCGWLFLSYANGIPLNTLKPQAMVV
jgi:hypothetical protein